MSIILNAKKKLLFIIDSIPEILREEAEIQSELIEDLNRQQLNDGEKADNTKMPFYVKDSRQPSAPGRINLKEKGNFQRGITAIFSDRGIDIDSVDKKSDLLVGLYGNILGLNDESILKLKEAMKPGVIAKILNILNILNS